MGPVNPVGVTQGVGDDGAAAVVVVGSRKYVAEEENEMQWKEN